MRRLLLSVVCLLLLSSCSADNPGEDRDYSFRTEKYEIGPYSLMLSYPDEAVEYGDTIKLELRVKYPEGEKWELLPAVPEGGREMSNLILRNISRSPEVILSDGSAGTSITIEIEAYLPGEIIFPPLTARFKKDIKTDEVIIDVESAFEADGEQQELSPIYIPEIKEHSRAIIIVISVFAVLLAVIILILLRRRRFKASIIQQEPGKTFDEKTADFKRDFIEADDFTEQREAFRRLMDIIELSPILAGQPEKREQYKMLCGEARFSRDGFSSQNGIILLRKIFHEIEGEELQ